MKDAKSIIENLNGLGNTKVISEKNSFYLAVEVTNKYRDYKLYTQSLDGLVEQVDNSDNLEYMRGKFDLLSACPQFVIIKEDRAGYPNNQSVVAISPKEEATNGTIIYYEVSESTGRLERREAVKAFAEGCITPTDTAKVNTLKEKLSELFKDIRFGKRLRLQGK